MQDSAGAFPSLRGGLALIPVLAVVLLLSAAFGPGSAAAGLPDNFERHKENNWVWYGPGDWVASSGQNDINISSPTGKLWIKFGASGVICPNSADEWFTGLRNSYRNTAGAGFGLYSRPLKTARYSSIGPTREISTNYFRQKDKWVGRKRNGQQIRGEFTMDVFAIDGLGTCGQQFLSIGAPSKGNAPSLKLLRTVVSTLASQTI